MNVLAVGAHPDDLEYGCFGSLAKHVKNGDAVYLLYVTCGAHFPEVRKKEAVESARRLKAAEVRFSNFSVVDVSEVNPRIIDKISEEIDYVKPQRVYVNSPHDTNQVHWTVSKSARIAARYVDAVVFFETPSTTHEFNPILYVDITDTIGTKILCLMAHKSQLKIRPYLSERSVKVLASYRFLQSRLGYLNGRQGYAEAFMVERMIG
jgi:LmbE family N-acetylglucosaminyl deacetylase